MFIVVTRDWYIRRIENLWLITLNIEKIKKLCKKLIFDKIKEIWEFEIYRKVYIFVIWINY